EFYHKPLMMHEWRGSGLRAWERRELRVAFGVAPDHRLPAMPKRCAKAGRSYSARFDFVAAVFRLRGRFGDFEAAPLRTARAFCSCSEADAARWRRSLRSLRSCFSYK